MKIRQKHRFRVFVPLFLVLPFLLAFSWDSSKFMSSNELQPNMKGIVKTVLQGTKIEELKVKILSVQRNAFPKENLIRARGDDETFMRLGILGGMSGSPVYVDGRLIGALAYGYLQSKEPIIGITPIEAMLKVFDHMSSNPAISTKTGLLPFFGNQEFYDHLVAQMNSPKDEPDVGEMVEIGIPLAISGFSDGAIAALKATLPKERLDIVQGSGGGYTDMTTTVEPGAMVGVPYLRGDLSVFGYGTITYRDGDRILIYGHPDNGSGRVNLPLSGGYVHCPVPSYYRGFKLAGSTKPFGTMVEDREYGCGGIVGVVPKFIPLTVHVMTSDGRVLDYSYEVAQDRQTAASMMMSAVWTTIDAAEKETGKYTIHVKTTIKPKDYPALVREDVFSGESAPGRAAASTFQPVSILMRNSFEELEIESAHVDVRIEDNRKTASIISARLNRQAYRPGQEMIVSVTLRPYLEEDIVRTVRIKLPEDAPEGQMVLVIGSASELLSWDQNRAPQKYSPRNIEQLIELLQTGEKNDSIVAEVFQPQPGLVIDGEEMSDLPVSMLYVMSSSQQSGEVNFTKGTTIVRNVTPVEFIVSGGEMLRFVIDKNAR